MQEGRVSTLVALNRLSFLTICKTSFQPYVDFFCASSNKEHVSRMTNRTIRSVQERDKKFLLKHSRNALHNRGEDGAVSPQMHPKENFTGILLLPISLIMINKTTRSKLLLTRQWSLTFFFFFFVIDLMAH